MRLNEESLAEHQRQIDVIGAIPSRPEPQLEFDEVTYDPETDNNPSNKFDVPDLSSLTSEDFTDFEKRHLKELAEQTNCYDEREQMVVAENLDPFICFNAVGKWMEEVRNQLAHANQLFGGDQ